MKPRKFFLVMGALIAVFIGGNVAQAQPLKSKPKPFPIVPATVVADTASGNIMARCGQDFVLFHAFQGTDNEVVARVVRLSNDPRGRAIKYHYYDGRFKLVASAVHVVADGQTDAPAVLLENPPGFWRSYAYHSENSTKVIPDLAVVTVVVVIRQKTQDCLLVKEVLMGGKG